MQSTNYFSLAVKSRAGEDLVKEGVDYKIIKDGNGTEYKVVNFDNEAICPREGIVQFHPLRVSSRHENRVGFRVTVDRNTGIIYGIPTGINPKTKELEFMKINLRDSETFDLTNPTDAMKATVIRNSHFLEGSPNVNGKAKYKTFDAERQALNFLSQRASKRKAVDLAEGLFGETLIDVARLLGVPPEANSLPTMHAEVIKRAEDNPKMFLEVYESPTRKEMTVFKRAMANGVIEQEIGTGYIYNGSPLGQTEGMVVEYLRDYPQVCQAIDMLSKKQESDSVKAMSGKKVEFANNPTDARIATLEAELAAKNTLLNNLSADKIVVDTDLHAKYLAEGKRLNIKNIHLIKSLDKVRDKVLEINPEFDPETVS